MSAAGAGSGACGTFERLELRVRHSAAGVPANGLEDVLDGDGMALELARRDGAAIKNQPGDIQPRQGHDAAGDGLVAADENNQGIEKIAAGHQLDGVSNDFAADERSAHALRAHGNAVGDGYGVELQRSAACSTNPFLDVLCQLAKVIVARADFDPGICHAHEWLLEVIVAKTGSAQHGACRRTMGAVRQSVAARLRQRVSHCRVPSMVVN